MAFSSNAPRFQAKVLDEETYIGPGYYEQKSQFERGQINRGAGKLSATGRKGTISIQGGGLIAARSMQQFSGQPVQITKTLGPSASSGFGKTAVTPGPGHYFHSTPNLNTWFKKSYNQNFNEV